MGGGTDKDHHEAIAAAVMHVQTVQWTNEMPEGFGIYLFLLECLVADNTSSNTGGGAGLRVIFEAARSQASHGHELFFTITLHWF